MRVGLLMLTRITYSGSRERHKFYELRRCLMKKKLLIIITLFLITFFISFYAIADYMVYYILNRKASHQEGTDSLTTDPVLLEKALIMLGGTKGWNEELSEKAEIWNLESYDNLNLYARFLKNDSHNYIILCHGFTGTHHEMIGRAEHFYRNGYNVLLPDARAHGKSEGTYRGMGYLEIEDVKGWIQRIVNIDSEAKIVLFGQSMGAATVMMTASTPLLPQVKCVIEDCGYISVWDVFSKQINIRYHLPSFPIMDIANIISDKKAGYSFKDASPIDMISNCHLPILMIHGEEDSFVPHEYLDMLYEAANEPKEKLSVAGAAHCMSMVIETELYWSTVDSFLEKHIQ